MTATGYFLLSLTVLVTGLAVGWAWQYRRRRLDAASFATRDWWGGEESAEFRGVSGPVTPGTVLLPLEPRSPPPPAPAPPAQATPPGLTPDPNTPDPNPPDPNPPAPPAPPDRPHRLISRTTELLWVPDHPQEAERRPAPTDRGRLALRLCTFEVDPADEAWAQTFTAAVRGSWVDEGNGAVDRLDAAVSRVAVERLTSETRRRSNGAWTGNPTTFEEAMGTIARLGPAVHAALLGQPLAPAVRVLDLAPAPTELVAELSAALPLGGDGPFRVLKHGVRLLAVVLGLTTGNRLLMVRVARDYVRDAVIERLVTEVDLIGPGPPDPSPGTGEPASPDGTAGT